MLIFVSEIKSFIRDALTFYLTGGILFKYFSGILFKYIIHITIFWGDGTKTEDVYGENVTVKKDYSTEGIYYTIVAGVIEDITDFGTNGIVVWNKL